MSIAPYSTFTESDTNPNKYFSAKIIADGTTGQVNVGSNPPVVPYTSQVVNSASVNSFPFCNGGNPFIVLWLVDGAGDIELTIM